MDFKAHNWIYKWWEITFKYSIEKQQIYYVIHYKMKLNKIFKSLEINFPIKSPDLLKKIAFNLKELIL
jgi:hypothetical protein